MESHNQPQIIFNSQKAASAKGWFSKSNWQRQDRHILDDDVYSIVLSDFNFAKDKKNKNEKPKPKPIPRPKTLVVCDPAPGDIIVRQVSADSYVVAKSYYRVYRIENTKAGGVKTGHKKKSCLNNKNGRNKHTQTPNQAQTPFVPDFYSKTDVKPNNTNTLQREKNGRNLGECPQWLIAEIGEKKAPISDDDKALLITTIESFRAINGHPKGTFTDVWSKTLDERLGKDYRRVVEVLEHNHIIEVNRSHDEGRGIKGQRTYGYRVTPGADLTLYKPSKTAIRRQHKANRINTPATKWLIRQMHRVSVVWDERHIKQVAQEVHNKSIGTTEVKFKDGSITFKPYNNTPEGLAEAYTDQLTMIENNISMCGVDKFGGRFYSPITNMKKEMRSMLRVDGQPLVEIDLVASNPLMLAVLCVRRHVEGAAEFSKVCEGDLYQHLADHTGEDRQKAKQNLLAALCASNSSRRQKCKAKQAFDELFPGVAEYCYRVKRKGKKNLAKQKQHQEAKIILDGVCNDVRKAHPDMFVATIHDAFLVLEKDVDYICELLYNQLRKWIKPNVRITKLEKHNHASN